MSRFQIIEKNLWAMRNVGQVLIADVMRNKRTATSVYLDIKLGNLMSPRDAQNLCIELLGSRITQSRVMANVKRGNIKAVRLGRSPFINKASLINAIQAGIFN